jgi:predicted nucleic acid-binding protein
VALEAGKQLLRKTSFETVEETLEMFTRSPRITTLYNDEDTFQATYDVFLEYPGLSLTDANIVHHMSRFRETTLFSFDRGFDAVKDIRREDAPAQ